MGASAESLRAHIVLESSSGSAPHGAKRGGARIPPADAQARPIRVLGRGCVLTKASDHRLLRRVWKNKKRRAKFYVLLPRRSFFSVNEADPGAVSCCSLSTYALGLPFLGVRVAELQAMYSSGYAAKVTGLTFRQLDHVVRAHDMRPSHAPARGSGSLRVFSEADLVALRLAQTALAMGLRLEPVVGALRRVQVVESFAESQGLLVTDGVDVRRAIGSAPGPELDRAEVVLVLDVDAAAREVRRRAEQTRV